MARPTELYGTAVRASTLRFNNRTSGIGEAIELSQVRRCPPAAYASMHFANVRPKVPSDMIEEGKYGVGETGLRSSTKRPPSLPPLVFDEDRDAPSETWVAL